MKTLFLLLFLISSIFIPANAQNGNIKQLDKDRGFNELKLGMNFMEIPDLDIMFIGASLESEIPFWRSQRYSREKIEFRNIKFESVDYGFINKDLHNIRVWINETDFNDLLLILSNLYGKPKFIDATSSGSSYYEWEYGKTILTLTNKGKGSISIMNFTLKNSEKKMKRFLKRFKTEEEKYDYLDKIIAEKKYGKKDGKKILKEIKLEEENNKWPPRPPIDLGGKSSER